MHDGPAAHDTPASPAPRTRIRPRRLALALAGAALVAILVNLAARLSLVGWPWETIRTTAEYGPPVLAGQLVHGACSGGFHARRGPEVVLTISGHCATEGVTLTDGSGTTLGIVGRPAREATCPYDGHSCWASDLIELVLAPDRIPWGHLNEVDLGVGGYRVLAPGTLPLTCADVADGATAEMNGRERFRTGRIIGRGEYLFPEDGTYFPCLVVADIGVGTGDSGAAVLVDRRPAGVVSRSIDGRLGFTPLAEGLALLGLELCTDPDCGLVPPSG
jgi:hypothetical protein